MTLVREGYKRVAVQFQTRSKYIKTMNQKNAGFFLIPIISFSVGKGDQIIAISTVSPVDSTFLPLNPGDNLEVISVTDEGLLLVSFSQNVDVLTVVRALVLHVRSGVRSPIPPNSFLF